MAFFLRFLLWRRPAPGVVIALVSLPFRGRFTGRSAAAGHPSVAPPVQRASSDPLIPDSIGANTTGMAHEAQG